MCDPDDKIRRVDPDEDGQEADQREPDVVPDPYEDY